MTHVDIIDNIDRSSRRLICKNPDATNFGFISLANFVKLSFVLFLFARISK